MLLDKDKMSAYYWGFDASLYFLVYGLLSSSNLSLISLAFHPVNSGKSSLFMIYIAFSVYIFPCQLNEIHRTKVPSNSKSTQFTNIIFFFRAVSTGNLAF